MTHLTSHAHVATTSPERYAKQLASHLGRRLEIVSGDDGTRVIFDGGECRVSSRPGSLTLAVTATDDPTLTRIEDVVGRHLVKFGARAELVVRWVRC